ncbi:MAG: hypothetical protein FWD13_02550 [Treponema sp.]|nr:hypothetical protein [Treponema sp.]
MKNLKIKTLTVIISSLVLFSCNPFGLHNSDTVIFWAYDFKKNVNYRIHAQLLAEGQFCNVWVERGSGITAEQAWLIADEYDTNIHLQMIDVFGYENPVYDGEYFSDIMEFAFWLSGSNENKLCILLLDIRDTYQKGVNDSFIAGYFFGRDFFSGQYSNSRAIIYIDTNPGMEASRIDSVKKTIAHEVQHLINYVTSVLLIENKTRIGHMDAWIDEGLSSAAEYICFGHLTSRINWFIDNGAGESIRGLIDKGNNFFVWGNYEKENIYALLDDYSTVYLFFQWLRLQSGGTDIYRNIITSPYRNHEAVVSAIKDYPDWETLLKTWLAANYINAKDGPYGYMDESALTCIKVPAPTSIGINVELFPGEGVYSAATTISSLPSPGLNIRYAGLDKDSAQVSDINVFPNGVLLTFNANTNRAGASEKGITTGIPIYVNTLSTGRSARPVLNGPFPIGGTDILRRLWHEGINYEK